MGVSSLVDLEITLIILAKKNLADKLWGDLWARFSMEKLIMKFNREVNYNVTKLKNDGTA